MLFVRLFPPGPSSCLLEPDELLLDHLDLSLLTVTLLSLAIILSATTLEWIDYRTVHTSPSLIVDKSRGEKLTVDLNITFPRVPCYRTSPACPRRPLSGLTGGLSVLSLLGVGDDGRLSAAVGNAQC